MSFTDAEKVQIRKYCGYPALGSKIVPNFGWRFSLRFEDVEFFIINLTLDEEAEVRNTFLANLVLLESDIPAVRDNSDTSVAAVWTRNKNELAERRSNYTELRQRLCEFIGCDYGPMLNRGALRVYV